MIIDILPILSFMQIKKLTRKEMCKLCNISYETLKRIMNQDLNIKLEALDKISKVINKKFYIVFKDEFLTNHDLIIPQKFRLF